MPIAIPIWLISVSRPKILNSCINYSRSRPTKTRSSKAPTYWWIATMTSSRLTIATRTNRFPDIDKVAALALSGLRFIATTTYGRMDESLTCWLVSSLDNINWYLSGLCVCVCGGGPFGSNNSKLLTLDMVSIVTVPVRNSALYRDAINEALAHIEDVTCVKFREGDLKTIDRGEGRRRKYVKFVRGTLYAILYLIR